MMDREAITALIAMVLGANNIDKGSSRKSPINPITKSDNILSSYVLLLLLLEVLLVLVVLLVEDLMWFKMKGRKEEGVVSGEIRLPTCNTTCRSNKASSSVLNAEKHAYTDAEHILITLERISP
jgi:hypothetical protein